MSDQADRKHELALTPREAARLLRDLADQLERGVVTLNQREVHLEHALVLEQSLKPEEDGLAYKLKLKYKPAASPATQPDQAPGGQEPTPAQAAKAVEEGAPPHSFKELKRALSGPFKEIKAALAQGGLPPAGLARGLWQTCQQLLAQTGGQDQGFVELEQQAGQLARAVEQGDMARAGQAVQAMGRIKSDCHARSK